jgi:hypothetical protein
LAIKKKFITTIEKFNVHEEMLKNTLVGNSHRQIIKPPHLKNMLVSMIKNGKTKIKKIYAFTLKATIN